MKIYITGPGGSGKSTISIKLAKLYNLPVIHLDKLLWVQPGVENKNYGDLQRAAIKEEKWIIEGPSCSIVKEMKNDIDLIILLNPNPIINVFNVVKRYIKGRFFNGERIGVNIESENQLSLNFLYRTLIYRKRQLPRLLKNINDSGLIPKLLEINSFSKSFDIVKDHIDNL
ncbi:MAG: hypothetical protein PHS92_03770 [Candidatus Gracilibacteria bacterium]|nr:hypothetical protein [Candidatus Gracilibacteria bacterium]